MTFSLAPLAGFTDAPFRLLCSRYGADKTYTEMVSAAALAHGHLPTLDLLKTLPGEGKVACQIFGATASDIAFATREIERVASARFCEMNLNAGCPMTKVTRCGAGAKLIEDPKKVYELLVAMKENTSLPISLKTRLGSREDDVKIFELLDAAERAGAETLIVHSRYTNQMHSGPRDFATLAKVVAMAKIPIIGNGNVANRESLEEFAKCGVAGVMVGRAALANPGIFRELKGGEAISRQIFLREHIAALDEFCRDDGYFKLKFRTHLFRYFSGIPGAAALRAKINCAKSREELESLCF